MARKSIKQENLYLILFAVLAPMILLYCAPINFFINTTDSMSRGIYFSVKKTPEKNDIVIADLAGKTLIAQRNYLPDNQPLLKRIFATTGDNICIKNNTLMGNSKQKIKVRQYDNSGRVLPQTKICRTLQAGEFFILGDNYQDSLDSRYLGIFSAAQINTVVKPLLIWRSV